ncbi:Lrp/AsnC family transcriptional regulator [Phytohalomonas tamaricis]|uniref:Lrp/AsnC family transcriptional regulator n=1 Tax=Phytohalomonas tamaricis TaxID=2081032 RepID=UPI0021D42700|nr:Lrp/AsnC family transcriptional regulator [Phytohalomonas tamaricis]
MLALHHNANHDAMNKLDSALLNLLLKDGRMSYADLARKLDISRAHARARVQQLVADGVIEQFTAVINPAKLGKVLSTFIDLQVAPHALEQVAEELAGCHEVINLYIMSDLRSLHIHTLTDSQATFDSFARHYLLGRKEILSINCTTLLTRVKHGRGGARL